MNTAVVYYSQDGSTRVAAQALAQRLGADVYELKEIKQRGRSKWAFMAAGFAAAVRLKSRVQDTFADRMGGYERVLIGTPLWAGSPVPAVNRFVYALDPAGKQIMIFTVQADTNPQESSFKGTDKLCDAIRAKGGDLLPVLRLHGEVPYKTAKKEHIEEQLEKRLEEALQNR
jgi:flavodoxin